ncbi:MAG: hypothetical protein WA005_01965 [Candidatus Binataceae bacterium]
MELYRLLSLPFVLLGSFQGAEDRLAYSVSVIEHIAIPEAQHLVPATGQILTALLIRRMSDHMLTAVEFDDYPQPGTAEVGDVAADAVLALEQRSCYLALADVLPELTFGVGWITPELPRQ